MEKQIATNFSKLHILCYIIYDLSRSRNFNMVFYQTSFQIWFLTVKQE